MNHFIILPIFGLDTLQTFVLICVKEIFSITVIIIITNKFVGEINMERYMMFLTFGLMIGLDIAYYY